MTVIAVECNCPLQFDLRFSQGSLTSAEHTQRKVGRSQVRILFKCFKKQPFGLRLILSRTATPTIEQSDDQRDCEVDLGINGLRVDNQCPFKGTLILLACL